VYQDLEVTAEQHTFGQRYRSAYGQLMKHGQSAVMANNNQLAQNPQTQAGVNMIYNTMDIGVSPMDFSMPFMYTCHVLDMADSYGKM